MKHRRIALILAAASVAAAGCGRRHGRTGQGMYGDLVADAIPKVEKAVGVPFKTPPKLTVLTRGQVRDFLVRKFDEQSPAAELAGQEAAYKAFGFIPDSLDLRKFLVDLLTEQIVGYYDPGTKTLYVVQGAPEDMAGVTVTHELVHALQDQYMNLDSIQRATGDNDRQMAAQAVIEGQATYEQMSIMTGGANVATLMPGGWDKVREMIRESQGSQPVFASAPQVIQEELLFPYLSGAEFIRRFEVHEPGKQPWTDMPVSTTQILHEPAYFDSVRDVPARVTLPATPGKTVYENDLGEFDTRLFLYRHTHDQDLATNASEGWDGGRYRILDVPGGRATVWVTVWRTTVDAAQFVDALGQVAELRYRTPNPDVKYTGQRTYRGSKRTVIVTPFTANGRSAVLYEDIPTGSSSALLDVARVTAK
ncbi:MAG TPA: hypothetical protein VFT41_10650 [Gemmatimonadaceae bacterium]|nr:hypothetical protein [Gemmatimonadaceae bacterium]